MCPQRVPSKLSALCSIRQRITTAHLFALRPMPRPHGSCKSAFFEMYIDNPVTTLLHYLRKVVRLAFRETPLTTQVFLFWRLPCPRNAPLAVLRPPKKKSALRPHTKKTALRSRIRLTALRSHIKRTVPACVLSPFPASPPFTIDTSKLTKFQAYNYL